MIWSIRKSLGIVGLFHRVYSRTDHHLDGASHTQNLVAVVDGVTDNGYHHAPVPFVRDLSAFGTHSLARAAFTTSLCSPPLRSRLFKGNTGAWCGAEWPEDQKIRQIGHQIVFEMTAPLLLCIVPSLRLVPYSYMFDCLCVCVGLTASVWSWVWMILEWSWVLLVR